MTKQVAEERTMLTSPDPLDVQSLETLDYVAAAPPETLTDAVSDPERIASIDVARGLAILGILLVNIQFFAHPFGTFLKMEPPAGAGTLDLVAHYFTAIFCSGKFYPLFSLLFGVGFAIQFDRARRAGRRFGPIYLRRLAVLAVFGLIHGFLLWYGDILFLYSVAGLILFGTLMVFPRMSGRALIGTGIGVVLFSIVLALGFNLLVMGASAGQGPAKATSEDVAYAQAEAAAAASPMRRLFQGFENQEIEAPFDPLWMALEQRAYREGPYLEALVFRAMTYAMGMVFMMLGFAWHVLGMFFVGAGLMRIGFFSPDWARWHRRLLLIGLLAGLPLSTTAAAVPAASDSSILVLVGASLNMLGGPMMSLAYLCGIILLVTAGRAAVVTGLLANVGRMALTCYLLSTVTATFIMYHWGLARFGTMGGAQLVLIVVAIYAGLVILANLWLRFFQFGPMEWLWRMLTYLRPQPLARR